MRQEAFNVSEGMRAYVAGNANGQFNYSGGLELVDWCLFDTRIIVNHQTEHLRFFQDINYQSLVASNNYMPGMLPNPCALNIRELRLFGIASDMMFTTVELIIGNKRWIHQPSWTAAGMHRWIMKHHLFIPPLCMFRGDIKWDGAIQLGAGYGGHQLESKPIQMCLIGSLARAVC